MNLYLLAPDPSSQTNACVVVVVSRETGVLLPRQMNINGLYVFSNTGRFTTSCFIGLKCHYYASYLSYVYIYI